MAEASVTTLKGQFNRLDGLRKQYLTRGRKCAELTIPTVLPPEGATASTAFPTPWQSLGARGTNNLAAKLLLALFPANTAFFRMTLSEFALEKLTGQEGMRAKIEEALDGMERTVKQDLEGSNLRTAMFEVFKHLIIVGNILVVQLDNGLFKTFRLDRYVVKRDPAGNVLRIITRESLSPMEVPAATMEQLKLAGADLSPGADDSIELYTGLERTPENWRVWQEIGGQEVPGTSGTYPLDKSPWLPLRFIAVDGEDYGRSYVEEYLGDLMSLEGLNKAIVQGSAAAAKVLFLVKPNATTDQTALVNSESGDVKVGNKEDVSVLSLEKYADFRVALETIKNIETRLAHAFLLNSAVQRQAERVTAEEIRLMAAELETALGGLYSTLSQELQMPVVTRRMHLMERKGQLPALPKGMVRPVIVTGVEALGRGNDLNKLAGFVQDATAVSQAAQALDPYVDVLDLLKRIAAARGIDQKGLVKTAEQLQQAQQRQAQLAMMDRLGPNAVTQLGSLAREAAAPNPQA